MGVQSKRLSLLAQVVQGVPVRRLIYPDGVAHLPRVCRPIMEDLDRKK
jgi:hypothetical protein